MDSTFYNKNLKIANTFIVGVFIATTAVEAQITEIQSTKQDSVFFMEQSSRYGELNLDAFQSTMVPLEFAIFKDFIGEDSLEVHIDDFEVFYPDDEE
jgi:hypothetical protein